MAGSFSKIKLGVKIMSKAITTLEGEILSAIEAMPTEFDTHQLILKLSRENQRAYVMALYESDSDSPFQVVHSAIGKALKRISLEPNARIREMEPSSSSLNIFGEYSSCSIWAKLE